MSPASAQPSPHAFTATWDQPTPPACAAPPPPVSSSASGGLGRSEPPPFWMRWVAQMRDRSALRFREQDTGNRGQKLPIDNLSPIPYGAEAWCYTNASWMNSLQS